MHPVIAFVRAFPGTRDTVCTEPVLAWLAARGRTHPFDGRLQRRLFARAGFWGGVTEVASRLGLRLELPRDLRAGEPIIFRAPDGRVLCGLTGPLGIAVARSSGALLIAPCRVLRVARG